MMNLQVFAEEKREAPTPRRRMLARQRGQVFRSSDLVSSISLFAGVAALRFGLGRWLPDIAAFSQRVWGGPVPGDITADNLWSTAWPALLTMARATALVFGASMAAGVMANLAQTGFVLTGETVTPRIDRLNPVAGLKRLLSGKAAVELLKAVLKICVVGYMASVSVKRGLGMMMELSYRSPVEAAALVGELAVSMLYRTCGAFLVLGLADMGYQWWEYEMSLRMTRQELKEELKETEGRPEVRARIRAIQRQIASRRMMAAVKKADVVLVNPTHYAVALKYEPEKMVAPVVVAKGLDLMAQRIRKEAERHGVAVVRNQGLAQALYRMVDVGKAIPPELYQAVAEVLAFVYRLRSRASYR